MTDKEKMILGLQRAESRIPESIPPPVIDALWLAWKRRRHVGWSSREYSEDSFDPVRLTGEQNRSGKRRTG